MGSGVQIGGLALGAWRVELRESRICGCKILVVFMVVRLWKCSSLPLFSMK